MSKYVFDLERSARSLRLNRFLNGLTKAENRKLFLEKPEEAMKVLAEEERAMIRRLDWKALQDYGATLEQFLKTRRVPGAR